MGKTEFKITGGREIAQLLREMPRQYARKGLVESFRAGAKIVADEARLQAGAKITEAFASDIVVARPNAGQRNTRGQGDVVVVVGFRTARRRSRLAHIFEFGTADRYGKDGHFTGRIIARPFFRPAIDAKGAEAIGVIAKRTAENLEIIATQLARRQKVSLAKKNRVL